MASEPVTEKLYYRDASRAEFEARIVEVMETGKCWEIILDQTCFYPEGGGQPADKGQINGISVEDVQKTGETIVHVLSGNPGKGRAKGKIDMNWRRDFMQQHTGQHIISAAFWKTAGFKTVSVHMGREYTTIEIDASGISDGQLLEVETMANRIIMEDLPVNYIETDPEELHRYQLRKPCPVEERIRLVKIGDIDCVGCGGLHFDRTGMVGPVKAVALENIRGNTRITWMIGQRALADYRKKHDVVSALKTVLETETDMVPRKTADLKNELDHIRKKVTLLSNQLADNLAQQLYEKAGISTVSQTRVVKESWQEGDDQLIKRIMKNLINRKKVIACLLNVIPGKIIWNIGCSEDVDFPFENHKENLMAIIDGKGGGRFPLWQGSGAKTGKSVQFSTAFSELAKKL